MKNKIKFIILLLLTLSILFQFGCASLTNRLWEDNTMVVADIEKDKPYFSAEKSNEIYVKLKGDKIVKIDIPEDAEKSRGFVNRITEINMAYTLTLKLDDFSKVAPELRRMRSYDFIIIYTATDYHDLTLASHSTLFNCMPELVDKMPENIQTAKNSFVPQIDVYYWENNRDAWSITWRCLATPFTFVADIFLVPGCYAYQYLDFIMGPHPYG